jgi:hypothetical protein
MSRAKADAILEHYATHAPHRVSTVILESCLQSYTQQSALTLLSKAMTPPRSTQPAAPLQGLARFIMQPPAEVPTHQPSSLVRWPLGGDGDQLTERTRA